jgi:hypothetical protein
MAITALYENSYTISGIEISLPNRQPYLAASGITTDGVFQAFLDASAMIAGDSFEMKLYEKIQAAGTQRVVEIWNFTGVQAKPHTVLPSFILMHGWD